ncbi:hypothetical protein TRFO_42469 [Tritrichomonas foetus]|uniref:Uncharacterized protein n=1 Tax=Tritrichomonas foetus TaxID=1144522 RepID=A0A1J4KXH8_9EUKA|nr:hypothetical protein TRFO_42469 [Tritrichomonas foetus]|eukprot:OHT15592.1 hypothetical protein TRFO_42469 [Tritrichomonas foetus]
MGKKKGASKKKGGSKKKGNLKMAYGKCIYSIPSASPAYIPHMAMQRMIGDRVTSLQNSLNDQDMMLNYYNKELDQLRAAEMQKTREVKTAAQRIKLFNLKKQQFEAQRQSYQHAYEYIEKLNEMAHQNKLDKREVIHKIDKIQWKLAQCRKINPYFGPIYVDQDAQTGPLLRRDKDEVFSYKNRPSSGGRHELHVNLAPNFATSQTGPSDNKETQTNSRDNKRLGTDWSNTKKIQTNSRDDKRIGTGDATTGNSPPGGGGGPSSGGGGSGSSGKGGGGSGSSGKGGGGSGSSGKGGDKKSSSSKGPRKPPGDDPDNPFKPKPPDPFTPLARTIGPIQSDVLENNVPNKEDFKVFQEALRRENVDRFKKLDQDLKSHIIRSHETLKREMEANKSQQAKFQTEIEGRMDKLEDRLTNRIKDFHVKLNEIQTTLQKTQKELSAKSGGSSSKDQEDVIAQLRADIASTQAELNKARMELKTEIRKKNTSSSSSKDQEAMQTMIEQLQGDIAKTQEALKKANLEIKKELRTKVNSESSTKTQEDMQNAIDGLRDEILATQDDLKKSKLEIQRMHLKNVAGDSKKTQEEVQAMMNGLKDDILASTKEALNKSKLEIQNEIKKKDIASAASAASASAAVSKSQAEMVNKMNELQDQLSNRDKQFNAKLQEVSISLQNSNSTISDVSKKQTEFVNQMSEMKENLASQASDIMTFQGILNSMNNDIKNLKNRPQPKINMDEVKASVKATVNTEMDSKLNRAVGQAVGQAVNQAMNERVDVKIGELAERTNTLTAEFNRSVAVLNSVSEKTAEIQGLKTKIGAVHSELDKTNKIIDQIDKNSVKLPEIGKIYSKIEGVRDEHKVLINTMQNVTGAIDRNNRKLAAQTQESFKKALEDNNVQFNAKIYNIVQRQDGINAMIGKEIVSLNDDVAKGLEATNRLANEQVDINKKIGKEIGSLSDDVAKNIEATNLLVDQQNMINAQINHELGSLNDDVARSIEATNRLADQQNMINAQINHELGSLNDDVAKGFVATNRLANQQANINARFAQEINDLSNDVMQGFEATNDLVNQQAEYNRNINRMANKQAQYNAAMADRFRNINASQVSPRRVITKPTQQRTPTSLYSPREPMNPILRLDGKPIKTPSPRVRPVRESPPSPQPPPSKLSQTGYMGHRHQVLLSDDDDDNEPSEPEY